MPYKDAEQAREAAKLRQQKHRNRVTPDLSHPVTPAITLLEGDPWADVKAYIERESPRMANLERLQRIAGCLGKRAGEVYFGISGLTLEDIGKVIGVQEGVYQL